MTIAKKRININMFIKKFWLLTGAFAILSAGVMGVNAYLSKKPAPAIETPKKITEESIVTEPEESTSTVPEEIRSSSEIDTADWETYRNKEYGFEFACPREIVGDIEELRFSKKDFGTLRGEKIKLNFTKEQNIILFARTPDYKNVPERSIFNFISTFKFTKCGSRFSKPLLW